MEEKERAVSVAGSVQPQINRYYLKVSKGYMAAGIVFMLLLVLYIMFVMSFFGDYITYDNMKYLMRDFSAIEFGGEGELGDIMYNGNTKMRFSEFRNGLAVVDNTKYSYYDTSGNILVSEDVSLSSPDIVPGKKLLLLYDIGGTSYSVFNQLTRIATREASGKIAAGDISDDGTLLLVMRSRETKYVVELYSPTFSRVMSIYKDNYVTDAAISPDGETIVICSAVSADTDFSCEIDICKKGQSESAVKLNYTHTMPLEVVAREDGFILVCDTGIFFYDYSGNVKESTMFHGMNLSSVDISEESIAIAGSTNALGSENRVMVFSNSGELVYDRIFGYRIGGVYASRDLTAAKVYITTPTEVIMIDSGGGEVSESIEGGDLLSVVPFSKGALICRKNGAFSAFKK